MEQGCLYLCATPIGNLEDMTYRAVRILKEVDLIAAEDTRHTRKLLSHFDIHTPLISYHEHNKKRRGEELLAKMQSGIHLALVSDAGLPGICDPGSELVALAVVNQIPVIPIPGANAALSALVASGLSTDQFIFAGFLPVQRKKRRELLAGLARQTASLIFYESPHRLSATLQDLLTALGNRPAVAARELTKKFEEFLRMSLQDMCHYYTEHEARGEYTLVIAGQEQAGDPELFVDMDVALQQVGNRVAAGVQKKEAIREVASELQISKRDLYQYSIKKGK